MIGEADTADILAGRYVDGIWSYPQILKYAEERGVSKSALDKAIIEWREALGEKAFLESDIQNGLEMQNAAENT